MSYTIQKFASGSNLSSSSTIASALNGPITNVSIDLAGSQNDYKFIYATAWGSGKCTSTKLGLGSNHQNRGTQPIINTYSKSTFKFTVPKMYDGKVTLSFHVYQNSEYTYDFGLFSNLNGTLNASMSIDSTGVYKSFKNIGTNATKAQTDAGNAVWPTSATIVTYSNIAAGNYTIDIKYRTDSSNNYGADNMIITDIIATATIGMIQKSGYKARNISEYYNYGSSHWTYSPIPLDYQATTTGSYAVDITKETTGRNYILWRFIAPATGTYKFSVKREGTLSTIPSGTSGDTGGSLWKATSGTTMPSAGTTSGSLIDNDDGSSYGSNQPGFSYACTAGVCYFFQLTHYNSTIRKTFAPASPSTKIAPYKYTLVIEWASSISLTVALESGYSAASNSTYIAYLKKNNSDVQAETVYIYPNSTSVLYPFGCNASNTLLYRNSGSGGWSSPVLMSNINLNTAYSTYNDVRENPHWSYKITFTKK